MHTTNAEDQREAARLQKRLQDAQDDESLTGAADSGYRIPNVSIDSGAHKYVLISAIIPGGGERQHFVGSRRGAEYHRNAAEPFVEALERSGYLSIQILGGGRIALDERQKSIVEIHLIIRLHILTILLAFVMRYVVHSMQQSFQQS